MQYHASSLINHGAQVHALAHCGSELTPYLQDHQSLWLHPIRDLPEWVGRMPRLLALALKAIFQFLWLLYMMLIVLPKPSFALIQLPPSIPTLIVCWLVKRLRGVVFVFDWHNFGYSLMRMSSNNRQWLVSLAKWLEVTFGCCGNVHMCVTKAMKDELEMSWGISANVVYDRPPDFFRRSTSGETHELMEKIALTLSTPLQPVDFCAKTMLNISKSEGKSGCLTLLTCTQENGIREMRADRPGIVVSSTSWTVDEDFSLLIDAACQYDDHVKNAGTSSIYPKLLFIVTGKGPRRSYYISKIKELHNKNIAFRMVWLEPEDYPRLLGCADLGVSLHTSSSGLDLPMKIVDMYGCGLPVCALGYSCLDELVEEGKTGLTFSSADELAQQLMDLFAGFPKKYLNSDCSLKRMSAEISDRWDNFRWESNWDHCALPMFEALVS